MEAYHNCRLCPRACGADRTGGRMGRCHAGAEIMAARAALHMWEEPCISGRYGSGAVFFSGCCLGCVFCQNHTISGANSGRIITVERLSRIFLELQAKGAHNINLVTPDHFAPSIAAALRMAESRGLQLPVICNCSGYMTPETIDILSPYVDIWLPDLKYYSRHLSERYAKAPDYFETAWKAIAHMYAHAGDPVFDAQGMMQKGMIVRHLVLPGQTEDSKQLIRRLHETYGDHIYISIMNQFTPLTDQLKDYPELCRKVTEEEYDQVVDYAIDIGVENGFIQEGETAAESFIPTFDNEGV